uniref:Uncharacterized protein n=1 Tax=Panagrolaimus davidi TaxID=227884 RepID=A0A914PK69_9BILA
MKLITLDRSKNVTYFGECEIEIEKCLNVTLMDIVPEEIMTATFHRVFVRRNNLLCCMNQNFSNVMIIVFPTKEKCKFIYDAVIKEKSRQAQSNNVLVIDENQIFKDCFYLPLVKAVQGGTPFFFGGHQGLKSIIAEFVESLDTDEVNYYFNNLPANLLIQTPVSPVTEETFVRQKQIVKPMHFTPEPETTSFHSSRTIFSSIQVPSNVHKRSISHNEDDEEEEKTIGTSRKKLKVSRKPSRKTSNVYRLTEASSITPNVSVFDEPSPQNAPENVIFDIVKCLQDGNLNKKLLVFTSNCIKLNMKLTARFIKHGGENAIELNRLDHLCKPKKCVL